VSRRYSRIRVRATWEGWLYLATVIDCHTKAVVGYATDGNYKTPLTSRIHGDLG
jgi:transposase InsO family protein